MFEKREVLTYRNVDLNAVMPQVAQYWTQAGFYVTQVSPQQISGTAYREEMGIRPQFFLNVFQQGDATTFDLNSRGDVQGGSIVLLIICIFLFWPLALILGLLAYNKYETQTKAFMYNFWGFLNHITGQAGMPPYGGGYYQPPPDGSAAPPPPNSQQKGEPVQEVPRKKQGKKKTAT